MATQYGSKRILALPPYIFSDLDKKKHVLRSQGIDLIDLSIGDPDLETPRELVEKCSEHMRDPELQKYPSYHGHLEFRKAIAHWMQKRFSVTVDPESEVLVLIGSKEGIAHAPLAYVDPGDTCLVPDIRYPIYATTCAFAGGNVYEYALQSGNGFLPNWDDIPRQHAENAKMLYVNYPNNPTGAVATKEFFVNTLAFAQKNNTLILHDNAYSETYTDEAPISMMQIPGAKDCAIEFFSLSKAFNMTGWRLGFAIAKPEILAPLAKVKQNVDSSQFNPIQLMGAYALYHYSRFVDENRRVLRDRIDLVSESLISAGISFTKPKATYYFWCKVPDGFGSSAEFCSQMLEKANVVLTPGNGFGKGGEGYFRISVTQPDHKIRSAMERLKRALV